MRTFLLSGGWDTFKQKSTSKVDMGKRKFEVKRVQEIRLKLAPPFMPSNREYLLNVNFALSKLKSAAIDCNILLEQAIVLISRVPSTSRSAQTPTPTTTPPPQPSPATATSSLSRCRLSPCPGRRGEASTSTGLRIHRRTGTFRSSWMEAAPPPRGQSGR